MDNRFEAFDFQEQHIIQRALKHYRHAKAMLDMPLDPPPKDTLGDLIYEVSLPIIEHDNDIQEKCAADRPRETEEE